MVCIFGEIGAKKDLLISCMAHYFFSHSPNLVDETSASIQGVHERNYSLRTEVFYNNYEGKHWMSGKSQHFWG